MIVLEARPLLNLVFGMMELERYLTKNPGRIDATVKEHLQKMADPIIAECEKLRLPTPASAARGFKNAASTSELATMVEFVRNAIFIGLNERRFFEPEHRYAECYENPQLFGRQVFESFPSATDDIAEAGTCLALERSTACVMHLMRAVEVCLATLAKTVGVTAQNSWGAYIKKIEQELTIRAKAAIPRSADEQFYAEAVTLFDHVRIAWRNPTMHVEKTYTQDRAAEILQAVKSFMAHLATKISE